MVGVKAVPVSYVWREDFGGGLAALLGETSACESRVLVRACELVLVARFGTKEVFGAVGVSFQSR